jgi:methylglyoxal reductase
MQTRQLGQSGIEASIIGLGTWGIGGWMWGGTDEVASIAAIHAAIDEGVNFIDTAPAYGLGLSEELVGKAIQGCRERVVLATKCGLVWHTDRGSYFFDENDHSVHRYLGAESIRYELEQSLRRLRTDYIDLYQTHWQDPTTPIEETMNTLLELKQEGKIRAIGISNASVADLSEYLRFGVVDTAQEKFSMIDREIEAELLPYCEQHGVAMLSYSSLALGLLTGKIGPERQFTGDDQRASDPRFTAENRQRIADMLREITSIAERYSLSIAQVVIAWTAHQPGITHVLCGARNPQQAVENARAGNVRLAEADIAAVDQVVRSYQPMV